MKRRIFLLNLFSILVFGGLLLASFQFYSIRERERLIDERIGLFLSSILSSEIDFQRLDAIEDQVADSLGLENSIVLVSLYEGPEHLLFRNEHARNLIQDQQLSALPQGFFSAHLNGHEFRGLNYRSKDSKLVIQVALLRDRDDFRWSRAARNILIVAALLCLLSAFSAWFTTAFVLKNVESFTQSLYEFSRSLASASFASKGGIPSWALTSARSADPIEHNLRSTLVELHEAQLKLKERFQRSLSLIAHELKTPLSVLTLALDAPERDDGRIREEIRHLNARLSELLAWSRYDTGLVPREELEALRVREILDERVPALRSLYPGSATPEIACDPELRLLAPRRVFFLLLENLLVNAFRHGERDSAVRIQVDARRLSISNRGRISSAVLERLGEPFNTSDTGAGAQGQGLGLAWVATLARSLGWIFQIRQEGERVVCEMCFEWFRFEGNS